MSKPKLLSYKLRAEAMCDITTMLLAMRIRKITIITNSVCGAEATFTTDLTLAEIKAVIAAISDGHVMWETVALAKDYTGERVGQAPLCLYVR
jgi:alkaline phosphatase